MNPAIWYSAETRFAKTGNKNGFPYHALFVYYPKKSFPELQEPDNSRRILTWQFKDGIETSSIRVARLVASALRNDFPNKQFNTYTFCIIPASTSGKTETRFKYFCANICSFLGMLNGYNFISVLQDHEQTKGNTKKEIIQYLNFQRSFIIGRNILLFDDVKTTGRSFYQCAQELKKLGANSVTGIFLGETYSNWQPGGNSWQEEADYETWEQDFGSWEEQDFSSFEEPDYDSREEPPDDLPF